ncbi:MAG: vitamin B12 dependent-methionine synthase activation domain-containing protein [Segetibacter sp.]
MRKKTYEDYRKLKEDFTSKKVTKAYLSYEQAVQNKVKLNWENFTPVKPTFIGTKAFINYDLAELAEYIDWQPFFIAWELHGKFPQILTDEKVGAEATKLYNDARALLKKIIEEKWLTAKGVIGFWPANSNGQDTITVTDELSTVVELESLRQQIKKAEGQPNMSLTDFIAPKANRFAGLYWCFCCNH